MQVAPHNTLAGCRLQPTRPCLHLRYFYLIINIFIFNKELTYLLLENGEFFYTLTCYCNEPVSLKVPKISYPLTACSLTWIPDSALIATAFDTAIALRFFAPLNINSTPQNILFVGVAIFFSISFLSFPIYVSFRNTYIGKFF